MRRSTLALVRRLVSGVRSSCAASCTSRSWASRAAASRPSMVLNDADSRPTSSRPSTGTARSTRPCTLTSSATAASRTSRRVMRRASSQPAPAAASRTARLTPAICRAIPPSTRRRLVDVDGHLQRPAAAAERGGEHRGRCRRRRSTSVATDRPAPAAAARVRARSDTGSVTGRPPSGVTVPSGATDLRDQLLVVVAPAGRGRGSRPGPRPEHDGRRRAPGPGRRPAAAVTDAASGRSPR